MKIFHRIIRYSDDILINLINLALSNILIGLFNLYGKLKLRKVVILTLIEFNLFEIRKQ